MSKISSIFLFLIGFYCVEPANINNDFLKINQSSYPENYASCDNDAIPPTFTLLDGKEIELLLPFNKITIFPKDLIITAHDDCTDSIDLIYKFWYNPPFLSNSPDSTNLSEMINVVDSIELSENNLGVQEVFVVLYDQQGNYAYLSTYLVINCVECDEDPFYQITEGQVIGTFGVPIDSVIIKISTHPDEIIYTKANGHFAFNIPSDNDYEVIPKKEGNSLLGVSSFDLLLIQKHILGLETFNSPYQFLAADVNSSGTVSTLDLLLLKKIILGKESTFPIGQDWVFVLGDYQFNTLNPAEEDYPTSWQSTAPHTFNDIKFIGVKLGDVNFSSQEKKN